MAMTSGQSLKCRHENSTKETNMTTQFITKGTSQNLLIVLAAVCCGAIVAPVQAQRPEAAKALTRYQVSNLPSVGGTSSGGNSINDQSWVAGYSRYPDRNRHAALWRSSLLTDLGTLGGPNSSVAWNVKNTAGILVGISQTLTPEPVENWSSRNFYSTDRKSTRLNSSHTVISYA